VADTLGGLWQIYRTGIYKLDWENRNMFIFVVKC